MNFKCADVICDFCGFLAQVKTATCPDIKCAPKRVPGAAWSVQRDRMRAGIYFAPSLVLVNGREEAIYYLSADLQSPAMFRRRPPLSANAKGAPAPEQGKVKRPHPKGPAEEQRPRVHAGRSADAHQ